VDLFKFSFEKEYIQVLIMALSVGNKQFAIAPENSTNKKNKKDNTSFGSFTSAVTSTITDALIKSDKTPMIGVSIIDIISCIGPRTVIDATRNGFAATETFLRESSGLIINCLTPSLVVLGAAKLISKSVMGKDFNAIPGLRPEKIWANSDSIGAISEAWLKTEGTNEVRIEKSVEKLFGNLQGLVGNKWKNFTDEVKNHKDFYPKFAKAVSDKDQSALTKLVDNAIEKFGASKNIRLAESPTQISCNFKELTRDINDLCHAFIKIGNNDNVELFAKKLPKLVNRKSIIGLAATMSIAAGVQWANRKLTKKCSGHDGFVGDPNYGKDGQKKKVTDEDKNTLRFHKLIGAAAMTALALFSFTKKPTLQMFQFKGWFPTMDQCRLISAATFLGRIFASEDKNELRETTIRDMVGFAHLYILGEFIAKGYASFKNKNLLNTTKEIPANANIFKKALHWMNNVQLKGFEELSSKELLNQRAKAQALGLIYSCVVLGVAVPLYNIWKTKKTAKNATSAIDNNKPMQQTKKLFIPPKTAAITAETQKIYAAFLK
jgi:hypothetical protein